MAQKLSDGFLETLRDRTDIETLIGEYVPLKRAGRLSKGLCPFHNEKTPSFTVYPDTRSYYCFGCGKGGDAITFIRDMENLDYIEAVKLLADRAGLTMPDEQYDDTLVRKKKRMLEMNRDAARFFHEYMKSPEGAAGLNYWLGRGLTPKTLTHFGLGFAPADFDTFRKYMNSLKYSNEEMVEIDLLKKREKSIDGKTRVYYTPTFQNRVMTPIIDIRGNVVGFGGRVLDNSKPKYVNTRDTLVYQKGQVIFALNFAKSSKEDSLILCEGYMDVITLHQAGFTNAIAGMGTALTDEQVRVIQHYCKKVYLSYDSDTAGQEALNKAISKFSYTTLDVHPLVYTDAKDPDEVIKRFGPERWKAILSGAMNETEYKLMLCREGLDISTDDGRAKYLRSAVTVLAPLGAIEKDIYCSRLSEETGVSREAIKLQVEDAAKRQNRKYEKSDYSGLKKSFDSYRGNTGPGTRTDIRVYKAEEIIILTLTKHPDFIQKTEGRLEPDDFISPGLSHVFEVYRRRTDAGQPIDLDFLSSELSREEMSVLVKLRNSDTVISGTMEEVDACIAVLKEEKNRGQVAEPASLSREEFLKLFDRGE